MILKMDIESAERIALEGARNTILNFHPKMAICVYHQFDDFYQIPKLILNIRKDYKIYFRHYSSGIMESVMFFIPKIEKEKN